MPWIIRPGGPAPWGEHQSKHLPTPKYTEWEARWEVWAEARRAARKVDAQEVFIEELYRAEPIQSSDYLPRTILWKKRGKLKDCISFYGHLVVSNRVRDLIEELEPRVHEFFEITMESIKTGEAWPEPFWLLHIRNNIDGIDDDQTHSQRTEFVFRAEAINGFHIWRDTRGYSKSRIFASDQFVAELKQRGIEGIGADPYCKAI